MPLGNLAHQRQTQAHAAFALGVICTGFAFWLFYRLIKRIGGPRTSTVTYLVMTKRKL